VTRRPAEKTFFLTVAGIDTGSSDNIVQSLKASGFHFYNVTESSSLLVEASSNANGAKIAKVFAGIHASDREIPRSPSMLNDTQLDRAVSFLYKGTSSVRLELRVGKGFGYRTFLISGNGNMGCPTQQAPCDTMVCPSSHRLKASASLLSCNSSQCTARSDLDTCCEPVAIKNCDPEETLTFSSENLLFSNLGGMGPHVGEGKLVYTNVFPKSRRYVDLVVTNISTYIPQNSAETGVHGAFGAISMKAGSNTSFEFRLVDGSTGESLKNPGEYIFSLVDMQSDLDETGTALLQSQLTVSEHLSHSVTDRSRIHVNASTFAATAVRSSIDADFPNHPWALGIKHMHGTVSLKLNTSVFYVHINSAEGARAPRGSNRLIFAGPTNMACPPRAYCSSHTCPTDLALIKAANETMCMGSVCTELDTPVCCGYVECGPERALVFDNLILNNLGGRGPDIPSPDQPKPDTIMYGNVLPLSGRHVNLAVSLALGSSYYSHNNSFNGLDGPFGRINFKAGSSVDLMFRFLDGATFEPTTVDSFFWTFSGIDKQVKGAQESVTVYDQRWWKTSVPSAISTESSCGSSNTTFRAIETGGTEGNITHAMSMSGALLNHSVTLLIPSTDRFRVTLKADIGWAGRNVLFTGPSNIVCGPKSPCLSMRCLNGFTLRADAHRRVCKGSKCLVEKDHDICCINEKEAEQPIMDDETIP